MKPTLRIALVLTFLALAGCGNKGPLVLPTAPPPAEDAPPPAEALPADATPTPENLNEGTRQEPVEGDASEGSDAPPPRG